jgi:hypothetical protein
MSIIMLLTLLAHSCLASYSEPILMSAWAFWTNLAPRNAQVFLNLSVLLTAVASSSSAICTADTEAELLARFQQTVAISSEADSEGDLQPYYNLTLTWDPAWGDDSWQKLGCLVHARALHITGSGLAYSLPDSFAGAGTFPQLLELQIANSSLSGSLPASWEGSGAFPQLKSLLLRDNQLFGTLPETWGQNGSLPELQVLLLSGNALNGSLPANWGAPHAFPALQVLALSSNHLTGTLPTAWGMRGAFPDL